MKITCACNTRLLDTLEYGFPGGQISNRSDVYSTNHKAQLQKHSTFCILHLNSNMSENEEESLSRRSSEVSQQSHSAECNMSENEEGTDSHQEKEEESLSRRSSEFSQQSHSAECNLSEKSSTSNFESDNYSSFTDTSHSIEDSISSLGHVTPENTVWYDLQQDVNDLDDDQDVIPLSESENRLNLLCLLVTLCLVIVSSTFLGLCYRAFQPPLTIYYDNTIIQDHKLKVPHIMILSSDGHMIPYTWKSNPKTTKSFPKLQDTVHSYQPGNGMVQYKENMYALSMSRFNGLTMIRPNGTNRVIHSNWKKVLEGQFDGYPDDTKPLRIQRITLVNNFIWALGLWVEASYGGDYNFHGHTLLWSIPRKIWKEGPKLPFDKFDLMSGCVLTVNRTFVMMIGQHHDEGITSLLCSRKSQGKVLGYDFSTYKWTSFQPIPSQPSCYPEARQFQVSCAIHHRKNNSEIAVMTAAEELISGTVFHPTQTLWDFDLKSDSWNEVLVQNLNRRGNSSVPTVPSISI